MVTPELFLQGLGLSSKEVSIYLTLLRRGASSVRQLADVSGVNRGTTYDILKSLQERGLVSYYDQSKKTYFVAEDPAALSQIIDDRRSEIKQMQQQLSDVLPQLSSMAKQETKAKPVARYYHGAKAIRSILLEVLNDVAELPKKEYFVYSSSAIAGHLYEAIPDYTKRRTMAGIYVSVIAFGPGGNNHEELAERRWLSKDQQATTYTIIFGNKTAFISLDDQEQPHGVILEDSNVAQTQILLFQSMWNTLK